VKSSREWQHYVPRFLLRRFADPTSRRVYVFDKLTSASFPSNPEKAGARNNYYNFEFGELEISLEKPWGLSRTSLKNQTHEFKKDELERLSAKAQELMRRVIGSQGKS
jgi:hypothetical protein